MRRASVAWAVAGLCGSAGLGGSVAACEPAEPGAVAGRAEPVIYGEDDRRDWYAHPDERLRGVARGAAVALLAPSEVEAVEDGVLRFAPPAWEGFCEDEPFVGQPLAAMCSGTLIDVDLVLTAGHCVTSVESCRSRWFAFDYLYEGPDALAVRAEDVYFCRDVVAFALDEDPDGLDYAVVQLDRPVSSDRRPLSITRDARPLPRGTALAMAGFPLGLPMKLDSGGVVVDDGGDAAIAFEATVDAYGGNSGSGVLGPDLDLVGVLVRGQQDFELVDGCFASVRVASSTRSAEGVVYARRALDDLCAGGWPSEPLCGAAPRCGDGRCTAAETAATCADDCAAACGDGRCDAGEAASCPDDCWKRAAEPPEAWVCPAEWYAAGEGCDCECGAPDLDCDDPRQAVFHCEAGATCFAGRCTFERRPPRAARDGGCALAGGEPPWPAAAALAALLAARRRRARPRGRLTA